MTHVVVLGGGISGMAAAWYLRHPEEADPPAVTLVEESARLGGKILTTEFAGGPVDEGPDAFLRRVPAAMELCGELGLSAELTSPATSRAYLWSRGRLRPLPDGLTLGVPGRLAPLARSGVMSCPGVVRAAADVVLPRRVGRDGGAGGDPAVGKLVGARFGRELQERLVDPLLGGINAARTEELSTEVAAPQLASVARHHRSLLLGLRAGRSVPRPGAQPVFGAVVGGMGRLVERLAQALEESGVEVRLGTPATALERRGGGGYRVRTGGGDLPATAVVVALPAASAAAVVAGVSPEGAATLSALDYASVAVVTLAYRARAVPHPLDGSGFLVPRVEGRLVTACSWMSSKWAEQARPGIVVVRASIGRWGDERALSLDDDRLVEGVTGDLGHMMGCREPPEAVRITRWPRSLPQYRPGHLRRVAALEALLAEQAPGVALAGAAYRGVGIATCIAGARAAAEAAAGRAAGR